MKTNLKLIPLIIFSVLLSFLFVNSNLSAGVMMPMIPVNNECSMATGPLAVNSTTAGSTTNATMTPSPPLPDNGTCVTSHTAADVWYTVTGTGNTMTATTCGDFFDYDTKLTVWCDECEDLTCIGGNDDSCFSGASGLLSTVEWPSTTGVEYKVMVHGFGSATGNFELTITDDSVVASGQIECSDAPVGGCCLPDATCMEGTQTECSDSGGTYQGDDTDCGNGEPIECPLLLCPGEGDCCEDNGSPGCEDCGCQETVCAIDQTCCDLFWDDACADIAEENCLACNPQLTTDTDPLQLYSYFDLRDRESFVQVTNVVNSPATVHVQIFNVNDNCNENNFFDTYTGNDTHVYNLSDITTNDGNPSGIVLPANAYGFVVATVVEGIGGPTSNESVIVGNFRILDNAGYEYRTNSSGIRDIEPIDISEFTFNYNIKGDIMLSDVVGINVNQEASSGEVDVSPLNSYSVFDIDIYNLDEVPFSCRDITFACIDEDNPLLGQLLESTGVNAASFDYGINDSLPHSRGGELLCPGNNIADGIVVLNPESSSSDVFTGYVGLNSGNGRGSMDSFWSENFFISVDTPQPEG